MSFWVVIEPFLQGFAVREDERMPAPACDGHDLRVLRRADDERLAAVCLSLLYDTVDAADERACCIDDLQPARLQRFIDGARDAVRADDDGASPRDLLGRGDLPHAERGKILALIGPNGAGKSTLLKTLAGQLAAQGGTVLLDGQDLTAYTPNARARKLALMLPHTARTELTTCFEVAAAGRYPYTGRLGILSDTDRQQVHDALCLVRAEELEDRDFARISDGQGQRVLLARAVCQQPEILLLDEPTSFLDVKGKAELMDILQVLAHEKNVAVIVTLHELELAQRLADAVVCVAPSGVSAVLAPQDAFAQDNICALFGLSTDQYAVLFAGSGAKPKPQFEHYIRSGQRLLRCGYTTGTCAAAAAAGAAALLLEGAALPGR